MKREAYLAFLGNVQCSIFDGQLNIQHYTLSITVARASRATGEEDGRIP
jgi:hypothetical protein